MTMTNHEHQERPEKESSEAVVRELSDLAPVIRRKKQVDQEQPDEAFLQRLWARLIHANDHDTVDHEE